MKLFLIIVGALVTAFVVCLLIFALWLRRLFRKFTGAISDQLGDLAEQLAHTIPPLHIDLEPVGEIAWQHAEEAAALIEPLRQAPFDSIGSFAMRPSDVSLEAFCRPRDSIYAIVYEHPKAGVHRKIGELSEPIAADVYVSPMERADDEDDDE